MDAKKSPMERAVLALLDLAREFMPSHSSHVYALTWIAAARLITAGRVPEVNKLSDLMSDSAWDRLAGLGLLLSEPGRSVAKSDDSDSEIARRIKAVAVVADLNEQLKGARWDLLPCLDMLAGRSDGGLSYIPGDLEELLLELAGDPVQGTLWIPFDPVGSLSIRASRRGWKVADVHLGDRPTAVTRRLVMAIEHGRFTPLTSSVDDLAYDRVPTGMKADVVIANPPFGAKPMASRQADDWLSMTTTRLDITTRSEVWAVQEFVNRATKRAVFLVPASLLFARGQEERLREYLLHRGGECTELEAVIGLPSTLGAPVLPSSAVMVLSPGGHHDFIRMVDLASAKRGSGSFKELGQHLVDVALGRLTDERRSIRVGRDEIERNETSFAPSRYLRSHVDVGPNSRTLGELCELVRPPSLSKVSTGTKAVEVGIAHLDVMRPIQPDGSKVITTRARQGDMPALEAGDIVLAIKGSVGKVGIVGGTQSELPAVVSQSCVALRLNRGVARKARISAPYLLMYLASEQGQEQLRGLQVGMGAPHISPATLMSAIRVPLPGDDSAEVEADYQTLCDIERQMDQLAERARETRAKRWTMPADDQAPISKAHHLDDDL